MIEQVSKNKAIPKIKSSGSNKKGKSLRIAGQRKIIAKS